VDIQACKWMDNGWKMGGWWICVSASYDMSSRFGSQSHSYLLGILWHRSYVCLCSKVEVLRAVKTVKLRPNLPFHGNRHDQVFNAWILWDDLELLLVTASERQLTSKSWYHSAVLHSPLLQCVCNRRLSLWFSIIFIFQMAFGGIAMKYNINSSWGQVQPGGKVISPHGCHCHG